jgi:hypothetical protein
MDNALKNLFAITDLRNRVLFTLAMLGVFRMPGGPLHARLLAQRQRVHVGPQREAGPRMFAGTVVARPHNEDAGAALVGAHVKAERLQLRRHGVAGEELGAAQLRAAVQATAHLAAFGGDGLEFRFHGIISFLVRVRSGGSKSAGGVE